MTKIGAALASVKAGEDGVPKAADVADEELPSVAMIAADHVW